MEVDEATPAQTPVEGAADQQAENQPAADTGGTAEDTTADPAVEENDAAPTETMDVDSVAAPEEKAPEDKVPEKEESTKEAASADDEKKEKIPVMPKEGSNFSLGVPGLSFSPTNVKTANDGTKMVQIHQSQITPDQLVALQNNPNIKVVFRHIPSGKSYTKPPRHLLPPGYKPTAKKRKARLADGAVPSDPNATDVYSFDEGEDLGEGPTKMLKSDNRARYNYGNLKKKGVKGRPRSIPDSSSFAANFLKINKHPSMPAKVILTDLLTRINNPKATHEVKLHTSQINAEVLANMDLNPKFKIVLTSKQELPPLVIEDATKEEEAVKEDVGEAENKEGGKDVEKLEKESEEKKDGDEEMEEENKDVKEDEEKEEESEDEAEKKRIAEEKEKDRKEKEAARQQKVKEEEEELMKSVQNQRSRSGRIRKPSRFSLDIARLTKKKPLAVGGDSSDEAEPETKSKPSTPASGKGSAKKGKALEREPTPPPTDTPKSRRRGRPRKSESGMEEPAATKSDKEEEKSDKEQEKSSPKKKDDKPAEEVKTDKEEPQKTEEKKDSTESEKKTEEATESEKEVTSTENELSTKEDTEKEASEKPVEKKEDVEEKADATEGAGEATSNVVAAEQDTSTDATKDTKEEKPEDVEAMDMNDLFSLKINEAEDGKEEINNIFRLRKLLEQCSADEIKSVFLPEALDAINFGDFLLFKSGQMHKTGGKVNFPEIYEQFESLHKSAVKEATRYNTLVKRANKVGGDKRMEKIVLMPVYHRSAADSLEISSMSIDAHICGIQKPMTTQMIAANSFFIKAKMDTPTVRLRLPEATTTKHTRPKNRRPLYTNHHQQKYLPTQRQPEPDSTTSGLLKPHKGSYSAKYSALLSNRQSAAASNTQVRKPAYLEQLRNGGQVQSGGQNHYVAISSQGSLLQSIPIDSSSNVLNTSVQNVQMTSALEQLQATVDQHQQSLVSTTNSTTDTLTDGTTTVDQLVAQATAGETTFATTTATNSEATAQAEQYFISDEGVAVASDAADGEVRKHLVPIGDGQYVELPEGYSLIQTDEGYIIGQPGSTFTQGEDGNVYVTNSDGTTSKITQEDTAEEGSVSVVDGVAQG